MSFVPGKSPAALRTATNPALNSNATALPKMNPRASIPATFVTPASRKGSASATTRRSKIVGS